MTTYPQMGLVRFTYFLVNMTFAIGCHLSVHLSVCRLSVVSNTRAPYSASWNFQQYF